MHIGLPAHFEYLIGTYCEGLPEKADYKSLREEGERYDNNPFAKVAIGRRLIKLMPKSDIGYFFVYDGLLILNMSRSALECLLHAFSSGVRSKYMCRRILKEFRAQSLYASARDFVRRYSPYFEDFSDECFSIFIEMKLSRSIIDSEVSDMVFVASSQTLSSRLVSVNEKNLALGDYTRSESECFEQCERYISVSNHVGVSDLVVHMFFNHDCSREFLEGVVSGRYNSVRNPEMLDVRRSAFKKYPESIVLLTSLIEHCISLHLNEEAYFLVASEAKSKILYLSGVLAAKKKLYSLWLKLSNVYDDQPSLLISKQHAVQIGLENEYRVNLSIVSGRNNATEYVEVEKVGAIKVASLISGQIRGYSAVLSSCAKVGYHKEFLSTWNYSASIKPRMDLISKIFTDVMVSALPGKLRNKKALQVVLPKTIAFFDEMALSVKNEVSGSTLSKIPLERYSIESESDFDSVCQELGDKIKIGGRFNQAKMFFQIKRAFDLLGHSEFDVAVRCRTDMDLRIDPGVLRDCVRICASDKGVVFVPYMHEVGYGDQYAIGSIEAIEKYCSAWDYVKANGFRYRGYFEVGSKNGAENFLASHLMEMGLRVMIAPIISRDLVADRRACEVIDARKVFDEEIRSLPKSSVDALSGFKKEFEKFCALTFSESDRVEMACQ
ncbi:hypothetical protein CQW32_14625 [Pseudomonas putida]|uniref:hypothetical protein n=1 Tax=Pseudomonas putida TaxID=303 RepID=UPI000C2A8074|nr:hypothetical protein [Pseudomonas putida]PJX09688.1 hypothetical protein CQW32_14625 [Pseudomonas putida]